MNKISDTFKDFTEFAYGKLRVKMEDETKAEITICVIAVSGHIGAIFKNGTAIEFIDLTDIIREKTNVL